MIFGITIIKACSSLVQYGVSCIFCLCVPFTTNIRWLNVCSWFIDMYSADMLLWKCLGVVVGYRYGLYKDGTDSVGEVTSISILPNALRNVAKVISSLICSLHSLCSISHIYICCIVFIMNLFYNTRCASTKTLIRFKKTYLFMIYKRF